MASPNVYLQAKDEDFPIAVKLASPAYCVHKVKDLTALSSPATNNTGNGQLSEITVETYVQVGNYILTITTPQNGGFTLKNAQGAIIGTGTVSTPFNQSGFAFTLSAGATAFVLDDSFKIVVSKVAVYKDKKKPFNAEGSGILIPKIIKTPEPDNKVRDMPRMTVWQDKNNNATISFDADNIYYKGVILIPNVSEHSLPISNTNDRSFIVSACHITKPLSEDDFNAYKTLNPALTDEIIGSKRVIVVYFNAKSNLVHTDTDIHQIIVFAYKTVGNYQRIYRRDFDVSQTYSVERSFTFAGFKTDGKNLIINTQQEIENDQNMGLYRIEFNATYAVHTTHKICASVFNKVREIQVLQHNNNEELINAKWTEQSTNEGGFVVVDVFQSKDVFTIIVLKITKWNYNYVWHKTIEENGDYALTSNQNRQEEWQYSAYKLDADNLILHKVLFTDNIKTFETANDTLINDERTVHRERHVESVSVDSRLIFANWKLDVFVWVKAEFNADTVVEKNTIANYTATTTNSEGSGYKLQVLKQNTLRTLDNRDININGVTFLLEQQLPANLWQAIETDKIKEYGFTYYRYYPSVFDGKYLLIACLNLDYDNYDDETARTLKMNLTLDNNDYVVSNKRADERADVYVNPLSLATKI